VADPHSPHAGRSVSAYLDEVRASRPAREGEPVTVPGERSESRKRAAASQGFELPDEIWHELLARSRATPPPADSRYPLTPATADSRHPLAPRPPPPRTARPDPAEEDPLTNAKNTPAATPHVDLGTWPTPVEPAPRLAAALGLGPEDLWIKRDDLSGLGGGGNKIRKLEWTVGAALAEGADTLVTTGAPQSNHARLTAAAGARLGLEVVLVFPGAPGGSHSGNLALDGLFGARVAWAGDVGPEGLGEAASSVCRRLRAEGAHPALVPFGGSSATGALGYRRCGEELLRQIPDLDTVVVALGSGGTMAGLVASLGAGKVLGVDTGALAEPLPAVAEFASAAGQEPVAAGDLRARLDMVGSGYGRLTEPVASALSLAARTEGIVLDPVYTGRAMAGLAAAVKDGEVRPGRRSVFLHTGGLPGLFGHQEAVTRAQEGVLPFPMP
jgi:L-cysteate sulfo-lyase